MCHTEHISVALITTLNMKKNSKKPNLEQIKQNIFSAKTEKEKKMWEAVLKKLLNNNKQREK